MYESMIWLVPVAIVLAGLKWPRVGLLIFAAALPLFGAPPGGPYLTALDVSALAAIATGLRSGAGARAGSERRSSLDVGVLAVLAVTVAASFPVAYRPPSWAAGTLANILVYFPEVERWSILYTWRAVANVLLGVGLYFAVKRAFATTSALALGRAFGVGLLGALSVGFLEFAGRIDLWTYRPIGLPLFDERFHSIFFHSGWMAEFVILATPLASLAWVGLRGKWKLTGLVLVILALTAVLFSGQRGAWLTALLQLGVAAVLLLRLPHSAQHRIRSGAAAAMATVVLIGGVVLIRPEAARSLQDRLGDVAANLSNRTIIWRTASEMASERPLLGWGAGSFSPVFDREVTDGTLSRIPGGEILGHHHNWLTAHNTYLMLLAERGGLGLASLLLLGWLAVAAAWRATTSEHPDTRLLATGLLVCAIGFAVYGLVQYLFFPRSNALLVWMLIGAVATLDIGPRRRRSEKLGRALIVVALVLLPLRALLWEPAPARGDRSFGFHAPEIGGGLTYQWTAAKHAVRRIAWQDEVLRLKVANGHPRASARPVALEVLIDGAIVEHAVLGEGWQELHINLGPPKKPSSLGSASIGPSGRSAIIGSIRSCLFREIFGVSVLPWPRSAGKRRPK
jgi:O-antigen ligase